jgi:hypothetical protein
MVGMATHGLSLDVDCRRHQGPVAARVRSNSTTPTVGGTVAGRLDRVDDLTVVFVDSPFQDIHRSRTHRFGRC